MCVRDLCREYVSHHTRLIVIVSHITYNSHLKGIYKNGRLNHNCTGKDVQLLTEQNSLQKFLDQGLLFTEGFLLDSY